MLTRRKHERRTAGRVKAAIPGAKIDTGESAEATIEPSGKVPNGHTELRARAASSGKTAQHSGLEGRGGAIGAAMEAIETTVYDVLCERFSKSAISKVVVRKDIDCDGDPVLRIVVVLERNAEAALDGRKLVGLVRHLRSRLEDEQFPLVTFVSKKEAGKLLEAC